jgi:tetratricopeptide (TPR) repeat protein
MRHYHRKIAVSKTRRGGAVTLLAGLVLLAWSSAVRGADPAPEEILRAYQPQGHYGALTISYPFDGAVFPPEIVAPTFRWKDSQPAADAWLVLVEFEDGPGRLTAPPRRVFDVAAASSWQPSDSEWQEMKRRSVEKPAHVTILGYRRADSDRVGAEHPPYISEPGKILSAGRVSIGTSRDEVGAPVFYRDVPLPFIDAVKDPSRIQWRLGPVSSKQQPPVVLDKLPVCANCHSFSANGSFIGLDIDYANDKGAYAIVPIAPEMVLDKSKIMTWSDFRRDDGEPTFGLLSQISPDGRYVISTVKDRSVFVPRPELAFSQLFFPVQGILVVYDTQAKTFQPLSGADDPALVQSNPSWSADGRTLFFARAKMRRLPKIPRSVEVLLRPEECEEFLSGREKFRFDLFRIPFNGGKGGTPEPLAGASANERSNYFPRCSPDGKWIVFCQADSFMLTQRDSALYILPATGGEARRMTCNRSCMNSWHSWSPNSRWLVFSSKEFTPYTQLLLAHVDAEGHDAPPVLLENFVAADRAANIPEFVNIAPDRLFHMKEQFVDDLSFWRAGNEFMRALDYDRAIGAYRKALELNPKNVRAHVNLATALTATQHPDEAFDHLTKAVELDPAYPEAHYALGNLFLRQDKPAEALDHFILAIRADPNYADALGKAGAMLLMIGRHAEAAALLGKASRLMPDDPGMHFNLAQALLKLGRPAEAIPHYEDALRLRPQGTGALNNLAIALADAGRGDEAIRRLTEAVTAKPGARMFFTLANLLTAAGKPEQAAARLRQALDQARVEGNEPLRMMIEAQMKAPPPPIQGSPGLNLNGMPRK